MTTQVIFKIEKSLKSKALKKAQSEGIPLSSIFKLATKAYVDGDLDVRLVDQRPLNNKTKQILSEELKEIKQGKNISPGFKNAKSAINYLKKL